MTREEAIETIKKNMPSEKSLPVYEALETLIPELCENEDERVRKEMIELLNQYKENGLRGIDITPWIAYLEKQKEQKPFNVCEQCPYFKDCPDYNEKKSAECIPDSVKFEEGFKTGRELGFREGVESVKLAEWSDEEKDRLNSIERLIVNANAHGNSLIGDKEAIELQHFIRSIVKPITNIAEWSEEDIKKIRSEEYTKGFNDAAFGGKIKEWSVEDEDRIRQIERIAQDAGCTQKLQEEIHDWLKSLRPQIIDSKPLYTIEQVNEKIREAQEWSEEDEKMLLSIINAFRNGTVSTIGQEQWLKNLPKRFNLQPKPGWSEEDEKIRQSIIKLIEFERNYTLATTGTVIGKYNEQINWLKSISLDFKKRNEDVTKLCSNEWSEEDERRFISCMGRLQRADGSPTINSDWFEEHCYKHPSWKPSEEQMKALEDAKIRMSLDGYGLCPLLQTLINDLKSL